MDGWNLGSSQQSLLSSYWWLREASETGRLKPGATVYLEMFYGYYAVGNEGSLHKALDWMKPSLRKGQAILDLCSLYPEYQPLDFLLPALRFHDRWTDLTVQDWNPDTLLEQNRDYRGYCPRMEVVGEEFLPLDRSLDLPKEKTRNRSDFAEEAPQQLQGMPLMYLHKITTYCREQGFHLVLVKTPTTEWTMAQHDSVVAFADAQGLAFVDFNMKNVFADAKYDFSLCNADHMHANQAGAALLTSYLTKVE